MDETSRKILTIPIGGWACHLLILAIVAGVYVVSWKAAMIMVLLLPVLSLAVLKPIVGFYLLVLFVPVTALKLKTDIFNPYLSDGLVIRLEYFVYHIIAVFVFAGWFLKKFAGLLETDMNKLKMRNLLVFVFSLLTFWFFSSFTWTPNKISGLIHFVQFLINIGFFYFAITIISTKEIAYKAVLAWLLIGVIFAAAAIIDRAYILPHPIQRTLIRSVDYPIFEHLKLELFFRFLPVRASGLSTFDQTSALINMTVPLALFLFLRKDARSKLIGAASFFVLLFARMLIPNKAGLGAFILTGLFLILMYKSTRKQVIKSAVIFAVIVSLTYLFSQVIFDRVADMSRISKTAGMEGQNSLTIRIDWWKTAFKILVNRYHGLGLGIGGFKYYITKAPHAHGVIQSFFFDLGIIGLIGIFLFIINLGKEFCTFLKLQNTDIQVMTFFFGTGVLAFLIQGLVDFDYHMGWIWLYLGTAAAVLNVAGQEMNREQGEANVVHG